MNKKKVPLLNKYLIICFEIKKYDELKLLINN